MSKERELLKALKESIEKDPYNSGVPPEAVDAGSGQAAAVVDTAGGAGSSFDLASFLDFFNAMGASMVDDPLFYVKILGLLILGVIILMVAFELILGG